MKKIQIGSSAIQASRVALGCMRINKLAVSEAQNVLETATAEGINFFDHADIYGGGTCEEIFGRALKESPISRENIYIQSKCGIRKGFFDFSKEHIIQSVEDSLKRLQVDYLDVLALHRPDALVEPEEVAEAFTLLEKSGKVNYFGVSNQNPLQMELLQQAIDQKLIVNQLQFSIKHTGMVDQGIHVNMHDDASINRDGSILDYTRLNGITVQAWSPFQYGFFEGVFVDNDQFPELKAELQRLADKYGVTPTGIAISWISRHPAKIQTIVGTMNAKRITEIAEADALTLTREEWYSIYRAAGNILP